MKLLFTLVFAVAFTASFGQSAYIRHIEDHRKEYKADFLTNPRSPLTEIDLKDLHFFPADSAYRVNATLELLKNQKPFFIPTSSGATKEYIRYAIAKFDLKGKSYQLTLYRSLQLMATDEYRDYLFLPFTDPTNTKETYGGGRYLDLETTAIRNNTIQIDFNKAYNPYCAYSSGYSCPVPPQENDLPVAIPAGEKSYTGVKKYK